MHPAEPYGTRDRANDQDVGGTSYCPTSSGASARRPRLRLEMDLGPDSDSSEGEDNRVAGDMPNWEGGFSVGSGLGGNKRSGVGHSKSLPHDGRVA